MQLKKQQVPKAVLWKSRVESGFHTPSIFWKWKTRKDWNSLWWSKSVSFKPRNFSLILPFIHLLKLQAHAAAQRLPPSPLATSPTESPTQCDPASSFCSEQQPLPFGIIHLICDTHPLGWLLLSTVYQLLSVASLFTPCWNYPEVLSSFMLWVCSLRSFCTKLTHFHCSRQPRKEAAAEKSALPAEQGKTGLCGCLR